MYRKLSLILLVLLLFTRLTGMSYSKEPEPQKVLKIGSVVDLEAPFGLEVQKWYKLYSKLLNEQGGWSIGGNNYKVEYTAYNCGWNNPVRTRSATEKAVIHDGLKYLINNVGEAPMQLIAITEPNKVLAMGGIISEDVVKPDIQYNWRANGVFFGTAGTYVYYKDMLEKGEKKLVLAVPDDEEGQFFNRMYSLIARVAGMEQSPTVFFDPNTSDFGSIATKIKSYNPDLVDMSTSLIFGPPIINALKQVGYKGTFSLGGSPKELENLVTQVGKEYLEGSFVLTSEPRGYQNDSEMLALIDAYIEEYGEWVPDGCHWASAWFLFEDAIESTQSVDIKVLKDYLDNNSKPVKTLLGYRQLFARPDLKNYRTVDSASTQLIHMFKDGKPTFYKIASVQDQYLVSIACYGLVDKYFEYWEKYGYPEFPDEPSLMNYKELEKMRK